MTLHPEGWLLHEKKKQKITSVRKMAEKGNLALAGGTMTW
jgi:hypothetical protein